MKLRAVIKIGSSSLTGISGGLDTAKLNKHASALAEFHAAGHEVILVTSGAIASGFASLGLKHRPKKIDEKQASAAVGQALLMQAYNQAFSKHSITVGQVLLTRGDFAERDSYNNALRTLSTLLRHRVIPIINENDTVATGEIKFGDNDILASLVACLLKSDLLVIITDTDGFYDRDPRKFKDACRIPSIERITPEIVESAKGSSSAVGTGGMYSKVKAAEQALANGIKVFIGTAQGPSCLEKIAAGNGQGTYFGKNLNKGLRTKKQWIAFHAESCGTITIDSGAVAAIIERGKSLLPVGVKEVDGSFKVGDVVSVHSTQGALVGKGIVNYSARRLKTVMGKNSKDGLKLNSNGRSEVIHRDDWVPLFQRSQFYKQLFAV